MSRDLVEAARRGDHEAFEVLATSAGDRLYAVARLILRASDLAEDAVQEALVRAWQQLPSLRDPDRFDAWLHRLLVNACADQGRQLRRWSKAVRPRGATGCPSAGCLRIRDNTSVGGARGSGPPLDARSSRRVGPSAGDRGGGRRGQLRDHAGVGGTRRRVDRVPRALKPPSAARTQTARPGVGDSDPLTATSRVHL
jgi:sigma-70-like protein